MPRFSINNSMDFLDEIIAEQKMLTGRIVHESDKDTFNGMHVDDMAEIRQQRNLPEAPRPPKIAWDEIERQKIEFLSQLQKATRNLKHIKNYLDIQEEQYRRDVRANKNTDEIMQNVTKLAHGLQQIGAQFSQFGDAKTNYRYD